MRNQCYTLDHQVVCYHNEDHCRYENHKELWLLGKTGLYVHTKYFASVRPSFLLNDKAGSSSNGPEHVCEAACSGDLLEWMLGPGKDVLYLDLGAN